MPFSRSIDVTSRAGSAAPDIEPEERQERAEEGRKPRRPAITTVLFVTSTRSYGGTEKHLVEMIGRLGAPNVRVSVLCANEDPYSERLTRGGQSRVVVSKAQIKTPWDWLRIFRRAGADIVVFVNGSFGIIPWHAYAAAWLAGIPRRYAILHSLPPSLPAKPELRSARGIARGLLGWRARHLFGVRLGARLCRKWICVSDAVRKLLLDEYGFTPGRTVTIHNGVAPSDCVRSEIQAAAFRCHLGIAPEDLLLVSVTRLREEKGIDVLLAAMARLLRDGLPCKCVIVGDGPLREQLSEQIRSLGLSGSVFLEGFQQDVAPYLQASDLFVLPSYVEGLPFAVLEAMAYGLPCVVTDVGGNAEAVIHNVQGLVVKPGSPEDVAAAVAALAANPDLRARMSAMARSRVREAFDIRASMSEAWRVILS